MACAQRGGPTPERVRLESLLDLYVADDQRVGVTTLQAEVSGIPPEDINDSPQTSPSHRLRRLVPSYRKSVDGLDAIEWVGLHVVRALCPRFDPWLSCLESLAGQPSP